MEVICLEDEAFYTLIETVVQRIKEKHGVKEDKWISGDMAMDKLKIKSKTTLQKLRDEGKIRFSQPEKKIILYDSDSIEEFLSKHAKDTF
ncbi:MAG: DNA-binding protein [Bacteroidia bacterium]